MCAVVITRSEPGSAVLLPTAKGGVRDWIASVPRKDRRPMYISFLILKSSCFMIIISKYVLGGVVETQQDTKVLDPDQADVWVGGPLSLVRPPKTDMFWLGLTSVIQLPGEDLHPAVRAAAEEIQRRQADLGRLRRDLAEREGPGLEQLMRELDDELDQDAAADQLARYEAKTKLLSRQIPKAEEAERSAWEAFSASLYVAGPEWAEYRQRRASAGVHTPPGVRA